MVTFADIRKNMRWLLLVMLIPLCYVVYKVYTVQIQRHDELYGKACEKYTAEKKTVGKRGEIFDRNGNLLVGNAPCSDLCADPSLAVDEEQCREAAAYLSRRIGMPRSEIYEKLMDKTFTSVDESGNKIEKTRRYIVIRREVEFEAARRIKAVMESRDYKFLILNDVTKRTYPKKKILANILGLTSSTDNIVVAQNGLEMSFDRDMTSKGEIESFERSRDGVPLSYGNTSVKAAGCNGEISGAPSGLDGKDVYLTISEPVQTILEEELDALMVEHHPKGAYAVMIDPFTGDIIAAAQRPTFDPNDRRTITPDTWRNRLAEDTFDPGSTMKPIAVSGALDKGIVSPGTRFDCERGAWKYCGSTLHDSHKMGMLTVSDIIQQSSNIGTAKIAIAMGKENLDLTLRAFGFGKKTGLPFPNETPGQYRPLEKWDSLSISRFCIGQGIAVSPLQLARAYCMLANGGRPVKLRIVDRRVDAAGRVEKMPYELGPSIFRDPATHHEIVAMMKRVTARGGTAKEAAVPGYYVAGKTGTAQKWESGEPYIDANGRKRHRGGHYSKSRYVANFIGFVPADRPRFVLLVTADEPGGRSIYGGTVAGPVFRAIAERTLKYMNVKPDYEVEQDKRTAGRR